MESRGSNPVTPPEFEPRSLDSGWGLWGFFTQSASVCILQGPGSGRQGQRGREKQRKTGAEQLALTELPRQLHAKPSSQLLHSNPPKQPQGWALCGHAHWRETRGRREHAVRSAGAAES